MQALEIVLKTVFMQAKGVSVGRSFYQPLMQNNRRVDLGDYYDLWTGLFQSTVLGSIPYLNVDIAHKAFPSPVKMLDMLRDMRIDPARGCDDRALMALKETMRGLRIRCERPNAPDSAKNFKFLDFGETAARYKFKNDDGKMMTVQEYFQAKHNVRLQFPNLPCVRAAPADRNIYLPMEFCSIADNQAVMKKCTEKQTRNMIREAATSTDVRKAKIMAMLQKMRHNEAPALKQFGIGVASEFTAVKARVLDAPTLEYGKMSKVRPMRGVWNPAGEFLRPMAIPNWAVLIMDQRTNQHAVNDFIANVSRH